MKESSERGSSLVKDVVCLMKVDPKTAPCEARYQGQTFYFCSEWCKVRFSKDPEGYLSRHGSE